MRNRFRVAIFVAIFFGFIAAYGIFHFLRQQREKTEAIAKAYDKLVVATKDIPAGKSITKEMIRITPWPKASLPKGHFSSPQQVVGKVIRVKATAGDPITEAKLAGERAGLTVLLTPGQRAMAVKVDEIVGVSGFLSPNDRVDVIATMAPPGNGPRDERISKIVLQNKRVLSVAQSAEEKDGKPQLARSITLELTPEESEKLSLASLEGNIILALRPPGEDGLVKTRGSTKSDLLAMPAAKPAKRRQQAAKKPAAQEKDKVEVYLGNKKSVLQF